MRSRAREREQQVCVRGERDDEERQCETERIENLLRQREKRKGTPLPRTAHSTSSTSLAALDLPPAAAAVHTLVFALGASPASRSSM